jgi:hypothetical protein
MNFKLHHYVPLFIFLLTGASLIGETPEWLLGRWVLDKEKLKTDAISKPLDIKSGTELLGLINDLDDARLIIEPKEMSFRKTNQAGFSQYSPYKIIKETEARAEAEWTNGKHLLIFERDVKSGIIYFIPKSESPIRLAIKQAPVDESQITPTWLIGEWILDSVRSHSAFMKMAEKAPLAGRTAEMESILSTYKTYQLKFTPTEVSVRVTDGGQTEDIKIKSKTSDNVEVIESDSSITRYRKIDDGNYIEMSGYDEGSKGELRLIFKKK